MNIKAIILDLKGLKNKVDWTLLLFLLLFLDVKLGVKIIAILLIYSLRFNFRFGFKLKDSRLPLFYVLIVLIGIIGFLINRSYAVPDYALVLGSGIGFWLLSILAIHQIKLAVERNDVMVIHQTILLFFLINAAFSFLKLGLIIVETHSINPYTYQGNFQKYFLGTGDYIKGVTFDTSTTNAVLNAFGIVYFLSRNNAVMLLLCMTVLLLTGSNFINLTLLFILGLLFIFKSTKDQKSLIVLCLVFLVVFMAKVSPQNNSYVIETLRNVFHQKKIVNEEQQGPIVRITERPDQSLSPDEKKEKIATLYIDSIYRTSEKVRLEKERALPNLAKTAWITNDGRINVPKDDINSATFQSLTSTPVEQLQLVQFIKKHQAELPISGKQDQWFSLPGKVISLLQTVNFFKHHSGKLIAGAGMGNFSSKLAFRVSGLGISGGYPVKYTYINPAFLANHLDLYLNFFSKRAGLHSLTNSPFSVYDQLFAEYGLLGMLAFFTAYIYFFTRHWKVLTYGLPILIITMGVLFIDYWFEQLSILIFFELFLYLNIKESSVTTIQL
ncbi:hypothetical protein [Pedobacter sp. L105]|uniref:hypothetical protein n=1 Tax=Pedobacter sp. L105 TaxID=1641871 RepID=UPI00131BD13E|nr:hypothetical protein [Pedobacter sp. L105]